MGKAKKIRKSMEKKHFYDSSDIVEYEINGEIWKLRRITGGEYEKMMYNCAKIENGVVTPNILKLTEEQRKASVVDAPDSIKKEFEEKFGTPWVTNIENMKKLDWNTYDALGRACSEINTVGDVEKNE
ncbi:MAG: hypothetical protein ACTSPB_02030 [Candidatus Thorarchaeota archaeon]